jgi:HPt (histidine-containing phosphotransfer) domain-containing protein
MMRRTCKTKKLLPESFVLFFPHVRVKSSANPPCKLFVNKVSSGKGCSFYKEYLSQTRMSEEFPFKIETLLEQCGGSKEVGGIVLDEFLVQVETDTKEMETCLANGDLVQAGKVGHRLKGTAGVLGAAKLHSLCFALEMAGRDGNAAAAAAASPDLKAEADRCAAAVPEARSRL